MKVTINRGFLFNIEGMTAEEGLAMADMIAGTGLQEKRIFAPIVKALRNTAIDKIPEASNLKLERLAREVAEMRRLQKLYFKTRDQAILKASIVQEKKVDELTEQINNQK